jgi:hypothetical protein
MKYSYDVLKNMKKIWILEEKNDIINENMKLVSNS